jgi:hypothetical protein
MSARRLRAHLNDPSGGLGYHLRALRYRRSLWAPFIGCVHAWLHDWRPAPDTLLLVGPSAGYTLAAGFLARFRTVRALEPDVLARRLLRWRFPQVAWHFDRLDCVCTADGPAMLAAHYPGAAILFCNVLGQAPEPALLTGWRATADAALSRHHWASFHDVLSSTHAPQARAMPAADGWADADALACALWRGAVVVTDHGTFGMAPHARRLACWQIAPQRWQVVEWGTHTPPDA